MNVVDSSGWIEYLLDTPRALFFASAIEAQQHLLVPVIALYEVHKVLSRKLPPELTEECLNVMRLGRVLDLTDRRAVAASVAASSHGLALEPLRDSKLRYARKIASCTTSSASPGERDSQRANR